MASLAESNSETVSILDPGAGTGILAAAVIERLLADQPSPRCIELTVIEIDERLVPYLKRTIEACKQACDAAGVELRTQLLNTDFLSMFGRAARKSLFQEAPSSFDIVIMNPPYRKISSSGEEYSIVLEAGMRTTNLYSAFMYLGTMKLRPGGQIITITPRSFCNGPYFLEFRQRFLDLLYLDHIHLFDSRSRVFAEGDVLQENVILRATKRPAPLPYDITISSATDQEFDDLSISNMPYEQVVRRRESIIHIPANAADQQLGRHFAALQGDLRILKLEVSTGRVVDFRVRELLEMKPGKDSYPLLYPHNLRDGRVAWPLLSSTKGQGLKNGCGAPELLIPSGYYVLVKRFSAKEEKKRIVASVLEPEDGSGKPIALENHLNYFHANGHGMDAEVAYGLACYLNSSYVDSYFRQFSGHTQVNASDLRRIKYPPYDVLVRIGELSKSGSGQADIDHIVSTEVFNMTEGSDPSGVRSRVEEAISILKALGLPGQQLNERSGLALLALLDLKPAAPWEAVGQPLLGVTPMMDWFAAHYQKRYAPNSRETVRRYTLHQFVQAGLADINPDDRSRPTNSPDTVYQVTEKSMYLLRRYGSENWDALLKDYLAEVGELRRRYAKEREFARIPVQFPSGKCFELSPGGQNDLIKSIVEEFCARFAPGASLVYIGDTASKAGIWDENLLQQLGFSLDRHGKMPDVVVYDAGRNWLYLIEAVTSHGPVSHKRHVELKETFQTSKAGLVFVTAFPDHKTMASYLSEIAWETEVWVSTHPDHIVHFDGDRFLGPYENPG
jgi:adenine-specific DNA-methyltransferase